MTTEQHAARIWSVVALAARNRQILTYDFVGKLIGAPRFGLGRLLEPIQSYCLLNQLPPFTILVVSGDTGLPGAGFIAAQDIPGAQMRVFDYDWLAHCPTVEELASAVRARPSNGDLGAESAPA